MKFANALQTRIDALGTLGKGWSACAACLATLILIAVRRPDQLLRPAVWVEDGLVNVTDYLQHGAFAALLPLNGYFVVPTRFIGIGSLMLSPTHFPQIASYVNVLVCMAVVTCIAIAPTLLRARVLCALFTLLVPTGPEVFGVSLYAFWWTTLLVVLAVLWEEDDTHLVARCVLLCIGGLSSPVVVGLLPLFGTRWLRRRTRGELVALACAVVCAALQLSVILRESVPMTSSNAFDVLLAVRKYVGYFFVVRGRHAADTSVVFGVAFLALVAAQTFTSWRRGDWRWVYLSGAWGVGLVMSMARAPLAEVHPVLAGPRYFFFPFVCMIWWLTTLLADKPASWRGLIAGAALIVGLVQHPKSLTTHHEPLDWGQSLRDCASGTTTYIPVHYDGLIANVWRVPIEQRDCMRLLGEL